MDSRSAEEKKELGHAFIERAASRAEEWWQSDEGRARYAAIYAQERSVDCWACGRPIPGPGGFSLLLTAEEVSRSSQYFRRHVPHRKDTSLDAQEKEWRQRVKAAKSPWLIHRECLREFPGIHLL